MPKAIIFDWGRTLFDNDLKRVVEAAEEILRFCKEHGCRLALVSKVNSSDAVEQRTALIEGSPLSQYLEMFFVTDQDKDSFYDKVVSRWNLPSPEIMIVDDRTIRGIKYGNARGHQTVWLQKGKYAGELPDEETGQPTYIINELRELKDIF